jgi:hypothetical protein
MLPGHQASGGVKLYAIAAAANLIHGFVRFDETAAQCHPGVTITSHAYKQLSIVCTQ